MVHVVTDALPQAHVARSNGVTSVDERSSIEERGVHEIGPGVYAITAEPPPRGRLGRFLHRARRLLVGRPLPSTRERRERLTWITGLAILGADLVASSVYGPEEMLRMLSQAGLGALAQYALPLALAIVVLLGILALSYWQTIAAYPNGAGGYIVATDNLGRQAGVVAAAALLIDYTLDIAVSVATGVMSFTSAAPALAGWHVPLALVALGLITLMNLRGIRVSGAIVSAPVYLYVFGTAAVIALGLMRWTAGDLPPYTPPPAAQDLLSHPVEVVGIMLLLRAFSSGAVALTGIEAVSNGIPYFKPPEVRNAHRTLAALAIIFSALFLGLSFLSGLIGVVPDPTEAETVHSQLTRTLIGSGPAHVVIEMAALLMLILAADTGFADFPRVVALLAKDGFLPEAFAVRGARLAFSNGIVLVAAVSAVLIIVFQGSVAGLVPLFTIGAVATFTISQTGMARHWWRLRSPGWRWRMVVNGFGAVVTMVVLCIVVVSKFMYGAWIVVVVAPILVLALHAVGEHHERLVRQVRIASADAAQRLLSAGIRHYLVIPVGYVDRRSLQAVAYARTLTDGSPALERIEAVYVTDDRSAGEQLRDRWDRLRTGVPMVILDSPYRATAGALLKYLSAVQKREPPHTFITVLLPEILPTRWWHPFVHNYFAWRLKWLLLFRPGTVVTSVPYTVRD
jgi:amino acid transporter